MSGSLVSANNEKDPVFRRKFASFGTERINYTACLFRIRAAFHSVCSDMLGM